MAGTIGAAARRPSPAVAARAGGDALRRKALVAAGAAAEGGGRRVGAVDPAPATMFEHHAPRGVAFGLAAVIARSLLAGLERLAMRQHAGKAGAATVQPGAQPVPCGIKAPRGWHHRQEARGRGLRRFVATIGDGPLRPGPASSASRAPA